MIIKCQPLKSHDFFSIFVMSFSCNSGKSVGGSFMSCSCPVPYVKILEKSLHSGSKYQTWYSELVCYIENSVENDDCIF